MLLTDKQVDLRLNSPMNILNRMKSSKPADLVVLPPRVENIVDNLESKLRLVETGEKAAGILVECLDSLRGNLSGTPKEISRIATDMSKIVSVTADQKRISQLGRNVQINIYAPQIRAESEFDTVSE